LIDESTCYYPSFRRPLTPSNPNPNRDNAAIALGSGVLADRTGYLGCVDLETVKNATVTENHSTVIANPVS
jgi:hypothetical protein